MAATTGPSVQVRILLPGRAVQYRPFPKAGDVTLEQFLAGQYEQIFSRELTHPAGQFFDWTSFTNRNAEAFARHFNFSFTAADGSSQKPLHLVDRFSTTHITIGSAGIYSNSSLLHFFETHLRTRLERIEQSSDDSLVNDVIRALEELLGTDDAQILLNNFGEFQIRSTTSHFTTALIPAASWQDLNIPKFTNYRQFLLSFGNQLLLLDKCQSDIGVEHSMRSHNTEWLWNMIHRMHVEILALLSIPEAFVRHLHPTVYNFAAGLEKCSIEKLPIKDDNYYASSIANRSIRDVYQPIFASLGIGDYLQFIDHCATAPLPSSGIAAICQTLRVIFNSIKHSGHVELIQSRDGEAIRQTEIANVDSEIDAIKHDAALDPDKRDDRLLRLSVKKEFIAKVRDRHEGLDFEAPDFMKKNGIRVFSATGATWFDINLADLELMFKLVVGVITILRRTP